MFFKRTKWGRVLSVATIVSVAMVSLSNTLAWAYIARTDNPPGTSGTIDAGAQIIGGTPFIIKTTSDPSLQDIAGPQDFYKYGADGAPIYNGNDNDGGIWGFDHVSHNGVPVIANNGYKMCGVSTVSQWISALKGDPSYVGARRWDTTFIDNSGDTFDVSNVAQIAAQSGASFAPVPFTFNQGIYATDPAYAQVSIVGSSQTVQQGKPIQFYNHAYIEAYHTNYHFEYVEVSDSNGHDVTDQGFDNASIQGKAPYNGESIMTPDGNVMTEVNGGGTTNYPPTFQTYVNGGSNTPNSIDTTNLQPGRYTIKLWVKDWFNRGNMSPSITTFTVTQSPGGGTGGGNCPTPVVPPKPSDYVENYNWSPDGSGGQVLRWTDSNWQLQVSTDAQGCIQYKWVDQPITYTHDYHLYLNNMQITGLFYDPGSPTNFWSPTNANASQNNHDQFWNGSTGGGSQALPTFGNPNRAPAVYVRIAGGFSFRLLWTGSPHDMPSSASVSYRLVNPNGDANTWTKTYSLLPSTTFNMGDVPTWDQNGNGYPPAATEYGWGYTSIPKYAVNGTPSSFSQLAKWNLTGDTSTAAHVESTVTFYTGSGSSISWRNTDIAQALGYPTWYFIHETTDPNAPYEKPQQRWSNNYSFKAP